ncbi:MAG: putative transport system ATP-binding protein [Actinomycetota bacterium]|jgi:putative ABC transport system ATP-binding protein
MLEIKDLTIEYSSGGYVVRPIQGFDLRVDEGELVLLLGASGSGKTTLLSAIAGLLTPASGTIRFQDTDVIGLKGAAMTAYRRSSVGVVFQAFNLVPSLPAVENVAAPLWASGVKGKDAARRAAAILEQVGLTDRAHHRPGDLSGGQQQRVAIARALAHDPPMLLADEPTAHLDYIQVEGILRLLRELAGPGRIVLIATHDERLLPLADRIVELTPRAAGDAATTERRTLAAGETVFRQGDTGELVYVVDDGEVEILRELAGGGEEVLVQLGTGKYFGELAPLFGLRRSATARATKPTVVTGRSLREFRDTYGADVAEVLREAPPVT